MLAITRKDGSSVRIGEEIKITVTKTTSGKVTLAIDAPQWLRIWREDVNGLPEGKPRATDGQS